LIREGCDWPAPADPVQQAVIDFMAETGVPLAVQRVERTVSERLEIPKRPVRDAIRLLVEQGAFSYTHRNGTAYLEKSFWGPVRVSDRIWLCPARSAVPKNRPSNQILVRMHHGAAFGIGDHPTTRLALRGIEHVVAGASLDEALDIGTGTGVLAIAAALLGVRRVLALDIDSCARAEAAANAAQNGLGGRIEIQNLSVDQLHDRFSLICANLRPPTLSRVAYRSENFSGDGALAVLSGFRPEEWPCLEKDFRSSGWKPVWQEMENGWMAAACRKGVEREPFGGR
jgi:ribosomal protein L11 methyltransferase